MAKVSSGRMSSTIPKPDVKGFLKPPKTKALSQKVWGADTPPTPSINDYSKLTPYGLDGSPLALGPVNASKRRKGGI